MKIIGHIFRGLIYLTVLFLLTAAISSTILSKPVLISTVISNSMFPLLKRGDIVFLKQAKEPELLKKGDIVVFKTESGSYSSKGWVMHRIVGGNCKEGFITKGDANDMDDIEIGGTVPVKPEWIVSKAITLGKVPLKIPLIGYLTLWLGELSTNKYLFPTLAIVLAVVIAFGEIRGNVRIKKSTKYKKDNIYLSLIYILGGLTLVIIVSTTMLTASKKIVFEYEVAEDSFGVLTNSEVGVLKKGETVEKPLTELKNNSFLPTIVTVIANDPQVSSVNFNNAILYSKDSQVVEMKLEAKETGNHRCIIWIGMFYPLLPSYIIYELSKTSYWLALVAVSLVPALPVMIYPFFNSRLRRKAINEFKKTARRVKRRISLGF